MLSMIIEIVGVGKINRNIRFGALVQMSDARLSESYGHDEEEKRFDELDN
jgi:hypothetical protein